MFFLTLMALIGAGIGTLGALYYMGLAPWQHTVYVSMRDNKLSGYIASNANQTMTTALNDDQLEPFCKLIEAGEVQPRGGFYKLNGLDVERAIVKVQADNIANYNKELREALLTRTTRTEMNPEDGEVL